MRCVGYTRRGRPCRNQALAGSEFCRTHAPALDPQAVQQLLQMLRAGNYLEVAALATGLAVDEVARSPALRADVAQARAEGEAMSITRIAAAARDNWQAAAWLLERQHPERWARPAPRAEEKPPPPVAGPDFLDELTAKRIERRGGR